MANKRKIDIEKVARGLGAVHIPKEPKCTVWEVANTCYGLTEQEAINYIKESGYESRIYELDKVYTCEAKLNRINLTIKDGRVEDTSVG